MEDEDHGHEGGIAELAVSEFWNLLVLIGVVHRDATLPPEVERAWAKTLQSFFDRGQQAARLIVAELHQDLDECRTRSERAEKESREYVEMIVQLRDKVRDLQRALRDANARLDRLERR